MMPATFLRRLWPDPLPEGTRIALWTKATHKSRYLSSPAEAGQVDGAVDVYFSAGLVPAGLSASVRLKAQEAKAIPGVWADIDINGGPEDKKNAAPDMETAIALAGSVLEPTILVNSGYGLQAWWLFEGGPWVFDGEADRARAAQVAQGWVARHQAIAREQGFKIDSVGDLARLMRLPGTCNGKAPK
jgi:putative DNA primase/helicase